MMSKKSRKTNSPKSRSRKVDPFKKSTTQALFFLNAILWLLYAFYIILDMSAVKNNGAIVASVGFFVIVNAIAMLAAGILIMRQQKWVYYFALGVPLLNIFLTLTNLTDFFFMLALILDLLILWILFSLRKSYPSNS